MNLDRALRHAKHMCDATHPSVIRSKEICPKLRMIQVANGQYITSQDLSRAKRHWTFEEFVAEFDHNAKGALS